ncbi:MAG: DUF4270 domain-containing protein [Prevotella sp.]|jgi:hypothetical protein|nr:DUF4270 domain-containing protein [Prevotella sp.]
MKIKLLLNLTIVLFAIAFVSCNDDLDTIGRNIQPGGDDISVYVDTVVLTAKTVSLKDSVYARHASGLLGEYIDPVFGKIKSDFLSELYCPEKLSFHNKTTSIDSVFMDIISYNFYGDSISPVGIAAYRVDKKNLEKNFFTNIKPADYCSMNQSQVIGRGVFTIKDADVYIDPDTYRIGKRYRLSASNSLGNEIYNKWKNSEETFFNSDSLRQFFKGIYVTTTLGSGSLIDVNTSILRIYYRYTGRNKADTADSTYVGLFRLPTTEQVIQLNQVQNTIPDDLFQNSDTRAYLKSPAGVCAEVTIPLKEIMNKAKKENVTNKLNSATFKLKGYTEEEEKMGMARSSNLLFINKDSLVNFFTKSNNNKADSKTSFIMIPDATSNTYNFSYSNIASSVSNNLATMVNYYVDYYKDKDNVPDLKFLILPITASSQNETSGYSQVLTYTNVYNQMAPTSAILRTDKENMKMALIFSNYNSAKTK